MDPSPANLKRQYEALMTAASRPMLHASLTNSRASSSLREVGAEPKLCSNPQGSAGPNRHTSSAINPRWIAEI
jgi:hypothetical protein